MCSLPPSGMSRVSKRMMWRSVGDTWKMVQGMAMKKFVTDPALCRDMFFGGPNDDNEEYEAESEANPDAEPNADADANTADTANDDDYGEEAEASPDISTTAGYDDVAGAFCHMKWHPQMVEMHCYRIFGHVFFSTGLAFGDNTCPPNWDTVACARKQLAQYFWNQPDTIAAVSELIPTEIKTAPLPSPSEIRDFTPAEPDSRHRGVLNADGSRKSPLYDHHVDDVLYVEIGKNLMQAVCASIRAL
ncbi:unnamed protein product [Cylindrotheca closterium]|uniref:Uncharacterized protein n=1 Tax=Cylindrotheca closterium TaxID=2856 RepID=A0AAD2CIG6_9STRA|nr:unnamed protein product [Cylindrotheca closterium]